MVEDMFFLDSKHLGEARMTPFPLPTEKYFYWQGKNNFKYGNPLNPKEYHCKRVSL